MAQLKENATLRSDVKRDILAKFAGVSFGGKVHVRIYLEEANGDFEFVAANRPDQPVADSLKQGDVVTKGYLGTRTGTRIFVEEI